MLTVFLQFDEGQVTSINVFNQSVGLFLFEALPAHAAINRA
jgi:hypothetical protein